MIILFTNGWTVFLHTGWKIGKCYAFNPLHTSFLTKMPCLPTFYRYQPTFQAPPRKTTALMSIFPAL